jgi:hypothetical protein
MRVSPSQIETFRLCKRKWAFKMIDGLEDPQKASQAFGVEGHKRIESWLKTGTHPGKDDIGVLVQKAIKPGFLPTPSPALLIEHEYSIPLKDDDYPHDDQLVGFIDCIVPPEGGAAPPVVIDHKFRSDFRYAMSAPELRQDVQALVYSLAAWLIFDTEEVLNRWIYYAATGRERPRKPKGVQKVEVVRGSGDIITDWRKLIPELRTMLDLRRASIRALDLEGTASSCDAFGGCAFKGQCKLTSNARLKSLVAQSNFTSTRLLTNNEKTYTENPPTIDVGQTGGQPMAEDPIVANLRKKKAAQDKKGEAQPDALALASKVLGAKPDAEGVNPEPEKPIVDQKATKATPAPEVKTTPVPTTQAKADPPRPITPPDPKKADAIRAKLKAAKPAPAANVAPAANPAPVAEKPAAKAEVKSDKKFPPNPPNNGKLIVLVNAAMLKADGVTTIHLIELLRPIMQEVADQAEKAHWALIPYGEGKALLAHAFDRWLEETKWKGTVLVDGMTPESTAVREVLFARADTIIRGMM